MKKPGVEIILLCMTLIFIITTNAYSALEAGRVLAIKKNVYVIRDNKKDNAKIKMPLLLKDAVETDRKSRTKLFFTDDSILNLGELSRVEVEEYLYGPERKRSKSIYRLMNGYMKVVVGRSDLEIHTPTAVVAARGTKFIIFVEECKRDTQEIVDKVDLCTNIFVLDGMVETWNINTMGVRGTVLNKGQMARIPADKTPEIIQTPEFNVLNQFTDDTVVMGDPVDDSGALPTLVSGPELTPPPPPPTILEINQQPREALTSTPDIPEAIPVTIDVNFP